jgi:hypothetical protein
MSKQQPLHSKAIKHLVELEKTIDAMHDAGACSRDGWNALLNTKQRLESLAKRCGTRCEEE